MPRARTDSSFIGERYGRLTIESVEYRRGRVPYVNCVCDCGNRTVVSYYGLRKGSSQSCGCLRKDVQRARYLAGNGPSNKTHGQNGSPTYNSWRGMMERCYNTSHVRYQHYGGRGIIVCERWHSFENFIADMGERPSGLTLDRKDNDGNYTPENCRWVNYKTQARDKQRNEKGRFTNVKR